MKKYKLIKQYPGSGAVGTITELTERMNPAYFTDNPDFYKEVVEKDYEILISRVVPQEILTVKRLSDREVFTIGDRAKTITSKGSHNITRFRIRQKCTGRDANGDYTYDGVDRIWIDWEDDCGGNWLESTEKVKQPQITTRDGVQIFERDIVWYVNREHFFYDYILVLPQTKFCFDKNTYFSTREAAEEYVNRNKPRLSIEDCFKILQKSFLYGNGFEKEIEKYVRKNNK